VWWVALQISLILRDGQTLQAFLDASPNLPGPAKELLKGCLAIDPTQRLTWQELDNHDFITAQPAEVEGWDSLDKHPGVEWDKSKEMAGAVAWLPGFRR
jgi:serine/threonine protein kinase